MKIQIIFRYVNSAFHRLYCLKFSFKLANISRSYEANYITLYSVHSVVQVRNDNDDDDVCGDGDDDDTSLHWSTAQLRDPHCPVPG